MSLVITVLMFVLKTIALTVGTIGGLVFFFYSFARAKLAAEYGFGLRMPGYGVKTALWVLAMGASMVVAGLTAWYTLPHYADPMALYDRYNTPNEPNFPNG